MTTRTHETVGAEMAEAAKARDALCVSMVRQASTGNGILSRADLVKFRELDAQVARLDAEFWSVIGKEPTA